MILTLNVARDRMQLFQDLVKSFDLRFVSVLDGPTCRVTVSSEHLPAEQDRAFCEAWERANTPIREIRSPKWKQLLRRLGLPL